MDDWSEYGITPARAVGSFKVYNAGYDEAETHAKVVAAVRAGELDRAQWLEPELIYPITEIGRAYADLSGAVWPKALISLGD